MQRPYQCTVNGDVPSGLWSECSRAAPRDLQQVSYWHAIFNTHGELGMCSGYWCCFPNWLCLGLCTPAVEFWWKRVLQNGSEQPVFSWITRILTPPFAMTTIFKWLCQVTLRQFLWSGLSLYWIENAGAKNRSKWHVFIFIQGRMKTWEVHSPWEL